MTTTADPQTLVETLTENIGRVIVGKQDVIELLLISLLSKGHVLIEDVPGVGKTMLARSLAVTTGCEFRRLQFTPDLLPSDVTGVSIFNQKVEEFQFRAGPIISQVVLADEINRATPKTQSALLEAMGERQVTVEGVTYRLPEPFMVLATQNPIEYEGTFPLPEAQLDRFFMRVSLGYPEPSEEVSIMDRREQVDPIDELSSTCEPSEVLRLQSITDRVYVDSLVKQYIVDLSNGTRNHGDATLGVSPRASINLMKGSKAMAMLRGRDYVVPDDVKEIALPVMAHRVLLTASARMRGVRQSAVVGEVLDSVPVPGAEGGRSQG